MLARRWVWITVVLILAALLGVGLGAAVVLRGGSLGSSPTGSGASRPTFVIGPPVSPVPVGSPSPPVTAAEYVVQPGDTLRSIAQNVYGDAEQWPRIYTVNQDVIGPDPDKLQAGTRLRIP